MRRTLLLLGVVLPLVSPAVGREAPKRNRLEHHTPAGVTYVVTADGLSEVRLGNRTLARGGWQFRVGDATWGFPKGPDAAAVTKKSLEIVSPSEARVTHVHAQAVARHTFTFDGEDVRIESWVENRHPTAPVQVAAFTGPRVEFGRVPTGILPNWHPTYTAAGGVPFMHPGGIRIGGSYGLGNGFGVGVAPHSAGQFSTAVLWDWDWSPPLRENDPARTPTMFVHAPIPARGGRTFSVTFRFSPTTDWKHLLAPYRKHLHATFGDRPMYDRPSQMPLVQGVVNAAESSRGPTNPHGYDTHRRIDSIAGVAAYMTWLAPSLRAMRAQGLVLWGQSGLHPRGAMYRPDFDALPPEAVTGITQLAETLRGQRMALGLTARPGQITQPLDWNTDTVTWLNVANPDDLELLTSRFNTTIARGARLFYLDSAGHRIEDVTILRAVRTGIGKQKGVGRDVQMYVEHPSDVVLPYSGLLPVLLGDAGTGALGLAFEGAYWLHPPDTPTFSQVMRYFYADAPVVALLGGLPGIDSDAKMRTAVEYCFRRQMTPMIPDSWLTPGTKVPGWLAPMTDRYLTADGKWKAKPDE